MLAVLALPSLLMGVIAEPPVNLAMCSVSQPVAYQTGNPDSAVLLGPHLLHVRFSAASNKNVTAVIFALNDGTNVVDAGTFSPGATIEHSFLLEPTDAETCRVSSVTFSDGETWTNDDSDQRERTQNPER
jgi:hypothetical protein